MTVCSLHRWILSLSLVSAAVVPACSIVVDTTTAQCSTDSDCQALGAAFSGTYCGVQKVCLSVEGYCEKNSECIARTGSDTTICRKTDNTCVGITSRECSTVYREVDDLSNDEAVIIGIHGIPSWAPIPLSGQQGVELARRQIVTTLRGLPASNTSNGQPRPLVLLACDVPIGDQAKHQTVTDHLIDVVGVPAIIGPYASPDWLSYALTKAAAKDVALITAGQTYPGFEVPAARGLRLSLAPPNNALTKVQAASVPLVEAQIRALGKTGELKLAFVSPGFGLTSDDAPTFTATATFNGKPPAANGANYREIIYGDPASPSISEGIASAIVAVREFAPDIVVLTGGTESEQIPVRLEESLPGVHYILRTEAAQNLVATAFQAPEERRKRVFGARLGGPISLPSTQRLFQLYSQTFEGQVGSLAAVQYDALYYLAWGMGSIKDRPITGRGIGEALIRTLRVDGEKIDTNSNGLLKAIGNIEQGKKIFAQGAAGTLAFDDSGQAITWEISMFCIDPTPGSTSPLIDSGIVYDGYTSTFSGSNTCF